MGNPSLTEPPPMATCLVAVFLSTEFPGCAQCIFCHPCLSYVILFSVLTALADCSGLLPACIQAVAGLIPGRTYLFCAAAPVWGFWKFPRERLPYKGPWMPLGLCRWRPFCWDGAGCRSTASPCRSGAQPGVRPGPYLRQISPGVLAAGITMLASACLPLSVPAMAPLSESWRPGLFHQEVFALFVLAGVSFLRFPQKVEKTGKDGYNRRKR